MAERDERIEDLQRSLEGARRDLEQTRDELARIERERTASPDELTRRALQQTTAALDAARKELDAERERVAELERELAQARAAPAPDVAALTQQLEGAKKDLEARTRQATELESQLNATRSELAARSVAAAERERAVALVDATIEPAPQEKPFAEHRREFYAALRPVFGNASGMVGERFILPADMLFSPGSAELGDAARARLASLAEILKSASASFPPSVQWSLRVDAHTEEGRVSGGRFASNEELSVARARAITRFLQTRDVPPVRLAANGYGSMHPLDTRGTPAAQARNRRIEIRLTDR